MLFFSVSIKAQESVVKIPKKAALYSAIIPGAGQVYTKKYWKIPLIYAGLITSAYHINESHALYDTYKQAYINRLDDNRTDEQQIGAKYDEIEWVMQQKEAGKNSDDFNGREREVFEVFEKHHSNNKHKMTTIPICIIPEELK